MSCKHSFTLNIINAIWYLNHIYCEFMTAFYQRLAACSFDIHTKTIGFIGKSWWHLIWIFNRFCGKFEGISPLIMRFGFLSFFFVLCDFRLPCHPLSNSFYFAFNYQRKSRWFVIFRRITMKEIWDCRLFFFSFWWIKHVQFMSFSQFLSTLRWKNQFFPHPIQSTPPLAMHTARLRRKIRWFLAISMT